MNEPLDYEWAMGLAKVMLTNDHPRGVLNLVRCFQDAEERAYASERRVRELETRIGSMRG